MVIALMLGMGGDDKSMEVFRNPGAGKDFPVDWYKYLSERSRYRARDGIGMDFGYAEDDARNFGGLLRTIGHSR